MSYSTDKLRAQNWLNFDFEVKLDLHDQGQSPSETINRCLNQVILHRWSKFGDPSLNGRWLIARTISWLIYTQTDTLTHATTIPWRPKLDSFKKHWRHQAVTRSYDGTLSNKLHWVLNQHIKALSQGNAFENTTCKPAAMSSKLES